MLIICLRKQLFRKKLNFRVTYWIEIWGQRESMKPWTSAHSVKRTFSWETSTRSHIGPSAVIVSFAFRTYMKTASILLEVIAARLYKDVGIHICGLLYIDILLQERNSLAPEQKETRSIWREAEKTEGRREKRGRDIQGKRGANNPNLVVRGLLSESHYQTTHACPL